MKRRNIIIKILLLSVSSFGLSSCSTYLISMDSFKQQFNNVDSRAMKEVKATDHMGEIFAYPANPIRTIRCTDKSGQQKELENSPSIEIRFTYGENNKRAILYFDTIYLIDTLITGSQSRFIPSIRKEIPINQITKIEVQDGRKKFRYAKD